MGLSRRQFLQAAGLSVCAGATAACGSRPAGRRPGNSPSRSVELPAFDRTRPAGAPSGLTRRVAWANTADTEIFVALGNGVQQAAHDRDIDYVTALAAGDPAKNVDQLRTFLGQGVGAVVVQPLDQAAQNAVLTEALSEGVCIEGIITHPCSLQVAAPQYAIGYAQGRAAAEWAAKQLRGRARVHYFNQDNLSPQLQVRHRGVLDGLKTGGDQIRVVSDITGPGVESIDTGFSTMLSVIERDPDINIVLGGDTLVVGAYRALQQVGKLSDLHYLSGVDGDSNALALVREGGPYRASFAFPWTMMGYAMGQFAADWIEGRQIPRVLVAKAQQLTTRAAVDRFLEDNRQSRAVYANAARLAAYLPLLGNTSHAARRTIWHDEYTL